MKDKKEGKKSYKSKEAQFFQSAIGREIHIFLSFRKDIQGKLMDVNTDNLTLYIRDSDGLIRIVPYSNRHVVYVDVREKEKDGEN